MTGAHVRGQRIDPALQATAIIHEAYLRLAGPQSGEWQNRVHLFAVASQAMRQVLVGYARRWDAGKRGGTHTREVEIDEGLCVAPENLETILSPDVALQRLTFIDARQIRLVELLFFAGLGIEEAAEMMSVSPITIKREWRSAKAWLSREMATESQ